MGAERPGTDQTDAGEDLAQWLDHSDRFRIVGRLGAGGMGVVYEARDLQRGMRVALKTLHSTNAQTLYRFKQEFRALAEIIHPRLIRLYELISDDERWFFTMELIEDGIDLLTWVRRDADARSANDLVAHADTVESVPPPPGDSYEAVSPTRLDVPRARALRERAEPAIVRNEVQDDSAVALPVRLSYERLRAAFAQLAEGVHALHAAGRLHRDLKPENVFVRAASGQVVLLDFGLVAALASPGANARPSMSGTSDAQADELADLGHADTSSQAYYATQAGLIAGTLAYMAPEQGMGQPLTAAADWYAVGIMLYEALTGVLPFRGSSAQILLRKQESYPVAPIERVPSTPADLSVLCMELLLREPGQRPLGAEVVARLGGVVDADDAGRAVFVGREQALGTLREAFEASREGTALASVHGRSGAGKSTLLARFLGELSARSDTLVVAGRCYEQEFIPYKAVDSLMDALTRYLLQLPRPELEQLLPADARVLARLFPVLGRLFSRPSSALDAGDRHAVRKRAFAAMRELLHTLSRRVRLVLFIDDLQWSDVDSGVLLSEVLCAPDAPPVLVVLSYRSEQRHDANAGLKAITEACTSACSAERVYEVDVGSLAAEDAHELATRLVGDTSAAWAVRWMLEQAAGSAFLIHELARYLHAGGAPTGVEGLSLDDILWERVRALPDESRALLSVVAVAGRPVRLRHAQRAAAVNALAPDVAASLCIDRLLRTEGTGQATALVTFHDRVRESILARVPVAQLAQYARSLALSLEDAKEGDAETLAALFERAGEFGRASTYYAAAVHGAVAALAFEHAERLAHKAIALAHSDEQRAAAYEAAIHFYSDMARFPEAYALTRKGVATLGVTLPEKFVPPLLIADVLAVQAGLWGKTPRDLLELPTMPEGRLQLAVRLANAGAKAAFQIRPELCVAVCTKIVRLCLTHGNSPDCAIGYMVFGAIFQGGILGRYKTGYELGQLALALIDKYRNERQRAEVSFVVGYFGTSWLKPAAHAEALWRTAFDAGRTSGDLFHMGCSAAGRMMSLAMRGVPLTQIEEESEALCQLLARNGLREPLAVVASVRQVARDLRGNTRAQGSWQDHDYDEAVEMRAWPTFGARHFAHYCLLARAQTYYVWGQLADAQRTLHQARAFAADSKGTLHSAEHVFLEAMVTAAAHERAVSVRPLKVWRAAQKLAAWAGRCPDNFAHKAELVRAEALRITGREEAALAAYRRAGELAAEYGHTHVEALSHLLSGRMRQKRGPTPAGARDLGAARVAFERWGASALAKSAVCAG